MRKLRFVLFAATAGLLFTSHAPTAQAQVGVSIGVAPDCPYGYYDVPPSSQRVDAFHFRGNEMRDGRGHVMKEKR
jgi:hypothetical protein